MKRIQDAAVSGFNFIVNQMVFLILLLADLVLGYFGFGNDRNDKVQAQHPSDVRPTSNSVSECDTAIHFIDSCQCENMDGFAYSKINGVARDAAGGIDDICSRRPRENLKVSFQEPVVTGCVEYELEDGSFMRSLKSVLMTQQAAKTARKSFLQYVTPNLFEELDSNKDGGCFTFARATCEPFANAVSYLYSGGRAQRQPAVVEMGEEYDENGVNDENKNSALPYAEEPKPVVELLNKENVIDLQEESSRELKEPTSSEQLCEKESISSDEDSELEASAMICSDVVEEPDAFDLNPISEGDERSAHTDDGEFKIPGNPSSEDDLPMTAPEDRSTSGEESLPFSANDSKAYDLDLALSLKDEAKLLVDTKDYETAIAKYTYSLECCPPSDTALRSILFANVSYLYCIKEQYEDAIEFADYSIELNSNYAKGYLRRYAAYVKLDRIHDAAKDLEKACELSEAAASTYRMQLIALQKQSAERMEKEKEELFGKLKSLGNKALGLAGLSLDNFECVQDPLTGSYSVNFKKNDPVQFPV